MSLVRQVFASRAWQRVLQVRAGVALLVLAAAVTELAGREYARTDVHDGMAILALSLLAMAWLARGGAERLAPLVQRVQSSRLRRSRLEIGFDLRQQPPVPAAIPSTMRVGTTTLAVAAVLCVILASVTQVDIRAQATSILYVGYLLGLMLLWGGLLCAIVTGVLLPAASIPDLCAAMRPQKPRNRVAESLAIGCYFALVAVAVLSLPLWTATVINLTAMVLFTVAIRWGPDATLLWRRTGTDEVRSCAWRRYETYCAWSLGLALSLVGVLAVGDEALGGEPNREDVMPVTFMLGRLAMWLGSMALAAGALFATFWLRKLRSEDPGQPALPTAFVEGQEPQATEVASQLESEGWRVRRHGETDPCDVQVAAVPSPMPPLQKPLRWPIPISARAAAVDELQTMLQRRDADQRREHIITGLERLFEGVGERTFARGSGFWLAPHYWHVSGMTRDVDEDRGPDGNSLVSGMIGKPYHHVFPQPARAYLHTLCQELDIDLFFIEDGVGYVGVRRVFQRLFRLHDRNRGLRIEERDLVGVRGLRLILHDHEMGSALAAKGYPEPDYQTLGRARILHVFRDRGEDEVPDVLPADLTDLPVPVLV